MSKLRDGITNLMNDATSNIGKSRRPICGIHEIHAAIRSDRYGSCPHLAIELSAQRKTIQRDLT
jgi:hypothetical protein